MNNSKLDSLCPLPFYEGPDQTDLQFPEWDCNKEWAYGQIYPFIVPKGYSPTAQIYLGDLNTVDTVKIYSADTRTPVVTIADDGRVYSVEPIASRDSEYMLVIYTSLENGPLAQLNLQEGRYFFVVLSNGDKFWYSDIFTIVDRNRDRAIGPPPSQQVLDVDSYIELQWRDNADFTTDDGIVVYNLRTRALQQQSTPYWNRLYIMSDIGMPDYKFEEEGESRDGYFFPFKQISKKVYRFNFLAPEYLCDSLRLVRMADHIQIRYKGNTYSVTGFSPAFEWQDGGWLASVEIEFETKTVAKKVGTGIYIR